MRVVFFFKVSVTGWKRSLHIHPTRVLSRLCSLTYVAGSRLESHVNLTVKGVHFISMEAVFLQNVKSFPPRSQKSDKTYKCKLF